MHHGGIEKDISATLERSVQELCASLKVPSALVRQLKVDLEIPKETSHGDIASNIAMQAARMAKRPAMELATAIADIFRHRITLLPLREEIERIEVAPPGFINFFLSKSFLSQTILEIKRKNRNFGKSGIGQGIKLQIEFVSANPTGPLTIAHGRQAAVGDSIANILEFLGYDVTREYYLNDEGTQMDNLGKSIRARYLDMCGVKTDFPEDGYKGAYVSDIAKDFRLRYRKKHVKTTDIAPFREFGLRWILNDIKKDLKTFGVNFNVWYSQRSLRKSGKVEKALELLEEKGHIFKKEGAVWFRSTGFGDDKDRVVVKSDGSKTYLAPDIAYHLEKFRRSFRRIVDIWGPDHHGYVPRMRAAIQALGYPADSLSVLIVQLATLYRNGQAVSMSTRAGEFITLNEVMTEVGKDVTRFCFLMRRLSSHLDFDIEMAKKQSMENPVYYIQYAHARICSILEYGKEKHLSAKFDSKLLNEPEEIEILRVLRQFPLVVALAGKSLEPYVMLQYLQDLAGIFHSFYNKHRVIGDDLSLAKSRIVLVDCVRIVLANGLRLLGVSLPKKM
jgi:arginyl-tRNA synthetase